MADRPARIAYCTFSTGVHDARTLRMVRSALDAGCQVTVYARWEKGLPSIEEGDGYRLIRVPWDWHWVVPGLRGRARRRWARTLAKASAAARGDAPPASVGSPGDGGGLGASSADDAPSGATDPTLGARIARLPRRVARRLGRLIFGPISSWHWWQRFREFPLRPMGWAAAVALVAEPADIWHGMWAGSLPALARLRRRHGGRTIYDSRDIFMQSRAFARLGWPGRVVLEWAERRWARGADRVLTVNDAYAELLERALGVRRPPVVMNCPASWTPPNPAPDLIRQALSIPADQPVALYQGHLTVERGIEQAMDAILEVPGAALVLLGFGVLERELTDRVAAPPYRGRVHILPAVPPAVLLEWTASADVMVMAIQPSTLNHRHTTPQKLFEAFAAGVPVVASDLPGMAPIVRATRAGVVCDPTSPSAIAAAIRSVVDAPPDERVALRRRALAAAHERYNWETQVETLFDLYGGLLPPGVIRPEAPGH